MRIAYFLGSLNRGGSEILALDVFNNIYSSNTEFICVYRKRGELLSEFQNSGIDLIKVSPANKFDLFYFWKLRKVLKKNKVDIAHAHQPMDAFLLLISTWKTGIKTALTLHGHYYRLKGLYKYLTRNTLRRLDKVIFVSSAQQSDFIKRKLINPLQQSNFVVLHNGMAFDKFNSNQEQSIHETFNIPAEVPVYGSVGNFGPGRDQITICKFLKLLSERGHDFRFLFIGKKNISEPWRFEECVKYIHDHGLDDKVIFTGLRSDVPSILPKLDAFIYSSEHDTFGIAVLEAIAASTVVFVNDIEVMNEITENGTLANIFKSKNERDLFEKFISFCQAPEIYKKKARESADTVKDHYGIHKYTERLNNIYQDL